MILSDKLKKQLVELQQSIDEAIFYNNIIDLQLVNLIKNMEKTRYTLLEEIKTINKNTEFECMKIKTIDDEYKVQFKDNVLKIYIPDILLSYKNLKTHTNKKILLNVAEVTKPFAHTFENEVFIYIKVFDKISNWDIDNKYIKPVADALIMSEVIKDDNITKMSYCVKGEYSEKPHTEIYIFDSKKINNLLESYCTEK